MIFLAFRFFVFFLTTRATGFSLSMQRLLVLRGGSGSVVVVIGMVVDATTTLVRIGRLLLLLDSQTGRDNVVADGRERGGGWARGDFNP